MRELKTTANTSSSEIVLSGSPLSIKDVVAVARGSVKPRLTADGIVLDRMVAAESLVDRAVDEDWQVYGVTTGFGGMANVALPCQFAAESQENLMVFLAAGAGRPIAKRHVRAAMLLRANVLARGVSGVRPVLIKRLLRLLGADAIPIVRELGSIGASGDLVPLASIARAVSGQSRRCWVQIADREVDVATALRELDLAPIALRAKEGLALVNGTSFSSAVAANSLYEARQLLSVSVAIQAMMLRALRVQRDAFHPFIHQHKPHPGQVWAAHIMHSLLVTDSPEKNGQLQPVQDRYSLRCLPQYMGPLIEGMIRLERVVETEMNAVSDNPLADVANQRFREGGNFLGQYIAIGMDDLRRFLGLLAKHLDVQIAQLVSPEFNRGLPGSLRGNDQRPYNMGLKGLQITGNSIMPMLTYLGNPVVEHYPTHAEQFNQNINGLSWGSANLAWQSVELYQQYTAVALIFAVQALDLRAKQSLGHYDGRRLLGAELARVYASVFDCIGVEPGSKKPFLFDDEDHWLEDAVEKLAANVSNSGTIPQAVSPILASMDDHFRNETRTG